MKKDELTKYDEEFLATIDMKMDFKSYELYQLLFSYISPTNLKKTGVVNLPVEAIVKYMDVDQNLEMELKNIVNTLQRQAVYEISNLDKEYKTYSTVSAIDRIHWDLEKHIVSFSFSEDVIPLIVSIKKKYPYFVFKDLASFQKKYSFVLYKYLAMYYKKYLNAKKRGDFEKAELYKNPLVPIVKIREMTRTENEYQTISNFDRRVLRESVEEINEKSMLNIAFSKVRKGRDFNFAVQFHISSEYDEKPYRDKKLG
ncbi:replication initiation protein [Enterococcus faecium]|uniref:replication initiation protein n=1 Tax=Enterococcus faecium TaxID=1352 RepID=UPI00220A6F92|nr:replication initiation protein [Enterococcus faecium]BDP92840.1 hypothetical protein EfmGK923_30130 [Enterococcus faecium]BDP96032.1 hypothetical protein EfmGK941_30370 [Enterococcus faecium]BDP99219.1 hypothetical protein EfmGK961_30350 [Enterococcus faecium]